MIRAVTFDLWNTLISDKNYADSRVGYLADLLSERGMPRDYEKIRDIYLKAHDYAHTVWREENYRYVPCSERLDFVLKRLGVHLPRDLKRLIVKKFEETILEDPPPLVEGAREVLEELTPGYGMGIICDSGITPGRVLRLVLEDAQILGFFKSTVFSDEVGYNKPHRIMFETALRGLSLEPSEVVHVGDLIQTDIAGAKAVGMKAVWLNTKKSVKIGRYAPDFEIPRLTHLFDVLKSIH
ncbi:MAG: HAD family hydrolase [Candidatus Bathyarchaeia archaeon]